MTNHYRAKYREFVNGKPISTSKKISAGNLDAAIRIAKGRVSDPYTTLQSVDEI